MVKRERTVWRGFGVAVASVGVAAALLAPGAADADYAPYLVVGDEAGAAIELPVVAGQVLDVANDFSGQCQPNDEPGTIAWTFGVLDGLPDIGGPVVIAEVITSGEVVTGADGNWTLEVTVPSDLPDGDYAVTAACTATVDGELLFDYFPATLVLGAGQQATTTQPPDTTTSTVPAPPPSSPPPAAALPGSADYTG